MRVSSREVAEVVAPDADGPALVLCEHASAHIPEAFGDLGVSRDDRLSHAVWDPGARDVALGLARGLESPMVAGRVSRLVYDCNRPPEAASAIPERSETIEVPGNRGLSPADRQARVRSVYVPFCAAVAEVLGARKARARATALITVHSFTPTWFGKPRAVEIGILHDADSRLADAILAEAHRLPQRRIARNAPYGPEDGVTHSLKLHGIGNDLPNAMIEIRNDLLQTGEARQAMVDDILALIRPALASVAGPSREAAHRA